MRYSCAIATVQVRELPEESYEVLRRRARRAGQSMQAYLRDQLVAMASRPTKDEVVEMIEAVLARAGGTEPSTAAILDDLMAERR
jgi:antitoxin FitA